MASVPGGRRVTPMRVLLDTTFAQRAPYSGTAVYLERLMSALAELDGIDVIEVDNRRRRPPGGGGLASVRNALGDQWWTQYELPRQAEACAADVIHHPLPARVQRSPVPQVVTVHDLAFDRVPDLFAPVFRRYARLTHRWAARGAAAVVCVSATTAADVRDRWGVREERLVIARHGPGQRLERARPPATPASHFLYVGDDEPRKNLFTLLEGYRRYRESTPDPLGLVLAGGGVAGPPGVRCEPRPSRERLAELYGEAIALVHPALYEGFGMTPLEAMSLGTPVIAADAPGIAEVCGEAARYVDPRDPQSIADALAAVAGSPALRAELAARGRLRAAQFSWTASARRHLEAYSLASNR